MEVKVMDCVNLPVAHDDKALQEHHRTSFKDEERTPVSPLYVLPEVRMTWNNQQAGCVDHTPVICAILAPLHNTPPSKYIYM
jgi:hypothetical protein